MPAIWDKKLPKNAVPRVRTVSLQPQAMRKIKVKAPSAPVMRRPRLSRLGITGDVGEPFVVQVTSRTSQTGALAAFADMQQKYPSLIGEFAPDIQRADLGSKGVWYRLRVGPVNGKTAAARPLLKPEAGRTSRMFYPPQIAFFSEHPRA